MKQYYTSPYPPPYPGYPAFPPPANPQQEDALMKAFRIIERQERRAEKKKLKEEEEAKKKKEADKKKEENKVKNFTPMEWFLLLVISWPLVGAGYMKLLNATMSSMGVQVK